MKNFTNYQDYDRKEKMAFETKAVHGGLGNDPITGAVSFPIFQTATYRHIGLGKSTGYNYSRVANPTRQELERTMSILENGTDAFAFSSGQAATTAVFTLLKPGDHILISDDVYGGTFRTGTEHFGTYGIITEQVDMSDLDLVKSKLRPSTRALMVETPTNPMMHVADIAALAEMAHESGILLVVDNTFLSPYFQKPLDLGADIVVHSATKYIGGHNDTLGGLVVVKDPELAEHFAFVQKCQGNMLSAMDSWLLLRGLQTLHVRMERHNENAFKVAHWLREQEKVKEVYYVGFEDHPGYAITKKQTTGFGGMISFAVESPEMVKQVLERVDLVLFAESLGGVQSLITYPVTQTHSEIPKEIRDRLGVTDCLVRLSVGIENVDDIIADLDQAING